MCRYGNARKVINENKLAQDISWRIVGLADEAGYFFPMIATYIARKKMKVKC